MYVVYMWVIDSMCLRFILLYLFVFRFILVCVCVEWLGLMGV